MMNTNTELMVSLVFIFCYIITGSIWIVWALLDNKLDEIKEKLNAKE